MAYKFEFISDREFKVAGHNIHKDLNGQWVVSPPIESAELQKAVRNYIDGLERPIEELVAEAQKQVAEKSNARREY